MDNFIIKLLQERSSGIVFFFFFFSLTTGDAIWLHKTLFTFGQVLTWCLMATSHYLNQCWLILYEVLWYSTAGNFSTMQLNSASVNITWNMCIANLQPISLCKHNYISLYSYSSWCPVDYFTCNHNSNMMEISFWSYPNSHELIATNFAHDSCAVMACAKMFSDIITKNGNNCPANLNCDGKGVNGMGAWSLSELNRRWYSATIWKWVIKFNSLFGDSRHRGPRSPCKPCNHSLYIGSIIFPHIKNTIYRPQLTLRKKILRKKQKSEGTH